MINVSVENLDRIQAVLHETPKKVPVAVSRAINRASSTTKTEAGRKIREKYYVKHGDVLKTFRISKASPGNLHAEINSKGSVIPLYAFRVSPRSVQLRRQTPITAAVKKGAGGPLGSAFVGRMGSGHAGVFARVGKPRLPINEKYGPSIPQMLGSDSVSQYVEQKTQEKLDERLNHELSRAVEGSG
ncbi:phage tail protein [Niallia sp. 03190]|uniref:phage tail protein n=1 Tax=Niallia sp. 03190 TaxID=3458061 RepID=UPI004043F491